ncbi:MAG: GspMb/PilO family protein [Burkholderiales bacterium]
MRARANAWLRRFGFPGVLGIGVLLACGGFWLSALKPAEDEIAAQRFALDRLRARSPYQPVASGGREEELRRFQSLFPSTAGLTDELERVHRLARRAGLDLAQGDYRLERRTAGLWSYRVTLPVRGTYPQLRDFVAAILKDMPVVSIDALRFERKKALDSQLDAQIRLTVHVRPAGESP